MLDVLFSSAVVVDGDWRMAVDVASYSRCRRRHLASRSFRPRGGALAEREAAPRGAALRKHRVAKAAATQPGPWLPIMAANDALGEARSRRRSLEDQLRVMSAELEKAIADADRTASELGVVRSDKARVEAERAERAERRSDEQSRLDSLQTQLPGLIAEEEAHQARVRHAANIRNQLNQRRAALASKRADLEVRAAGIEERIDMLKRRQVEVESRLERLVAERAAAKVKREEVERGLLVVGELARRLDERNAQLAGWLDLLRAEQAAQSASSREVSGALSARRKERQAAERDLVDVRERANRLELSEAENRVRLETLTEAVRNDLDTEPELAMQAPLPELPDGASPESRVRELERELKLLGPINPLALEEFEQLKERHEFLSTQLEDVKSTRKELRKLIKEVDDEIVKVFAAAYADVAANFVDLFETLFPGGKGSVVLTNGDDLLNCGIEIEAKPSGKNVKKLSLLSGGERTLTALGFLFAVFRSRPSPFYVMDEVEAALDDMNLHRFLSLVNEFRKDAQLVIVSHQKRTMEAAEVLYGVSMKPGGSSKVVSEKVAAKQAEPINA
ncbi:MAG: AAA family ATPase [Acidimicrobiales bacterium]